HVAHWLVLNVEPLDRPVHHWPDCSARPVISDLPSPLKSPTWTSTQVTLVLQVSQRELVKPEPLDKATHHWPVSKARPMMSLLPSPLKSPTFTSTHVTPVLQVVHGAGDDMKLEPFESALHQLPPSLSRPVMSALPSPLKSPTCTSTQVAAVLQVVHSDMVKALPLDKPTHHLPVLASRAAMSVRPSPLKSPETTSTQVIVGSQVPNKLVVKASDS